MQNSMTVDVIEMILLSGRRPETDCKAFLILYYAADVCVLVYVLEDVCGKDSTPSCFKVCIRLHSAWVTDNEEIFFLCKCYSFWRK